MKRETLVNLGFLLLFLAISLPGAVMLFRAKLDPEARIMYNPGHVRKTAAYNHPLPTASDTVRTFPPRTLAWVEAAAREQVGRPPLRLVAAGGRVQPLISDERYFELLDVVDATGTAKGANIVVLAWTPAFAAGEVAQVDVALSLAGETAPLKVNQVEIQRLSVPAEVIKELKDAGFVRPPATVSLLRLEYTPPASSGEEGAVSGASPDLARDVRAVEIRWRTGGSWSQDVLQIEPALLDRPAIGKDTSPALAPAAAKATE